eukprot:COSAG06_NODE_45265_length_356_cov_0.797665_1_plen_79_part_01
MRQLSKAEGRATFQAAAPFAAAPFVPPALREVRKQEVAATATHEAQDGAEQQQLKQDDVAAAKSEYAAWLERNPVQHQ